ncbi:carboxylate-amine ligase [Actinocorallia populi]|uniref:carboxylate-amine ligase n=1 Tax=Actinocorallia populi TaxID=2079200 RepID=UPI001E5F1A23|nr:glutamate--cysteine ligase [Actinocorallia populi]
MNTSRELLVGVEEEFHIVALDSGRLTSASPALLEALPGDRYSAELQEATIEAHSAPWARLEDLAEDLTATRKALIGTAGEQGLGVLASGTAPLFDLADPVVPPLPRFRRMHDLYRRLAGEQLICGAQVHVDVPDRDLAARVLQRLAPWLPVFLALSAGSPFWREADTGYASYRSVLWQRWPTAGPPGPFAGAAEYEALVAELVEQGTILDPGMVYFDVRPSCHLPTLELRICDACPRVDDVVLLAGLFRALVRRECAEEGGFRPVRGELLRSATWRAARSGLGGTLIDPATGRPEPAGEVVRGLLAGLRPFLEEAGDWELVSGLAEALLGRGDCATRQRAVYARSGSLREVVAVLLAETGGTG